MTGSMPSVRHSSRMHVVRRLNPVAKAQETRGLLLEPQRSQAERLEQAQALAAKGFQIFMLHPWL